MVRYFGIYSRRSKGKHNFIKMIEDRILDLEDHLINVLSVLWNILKEVVEYFNEMDQSNIDEHPCFSCKKMRHIQYEGGMERSIEDRN